MRRGLHIIAFCGLWLAGRGQTRISLVSQTNLAATNFAVDNLGDLYVITPDNQLKKFGPQGDSVATFDEVKRYGTLSEIDVTNPLKILLFYKDFMTVLALDRQLGRLFKMDLRQAQIFQASTVAEAYDGNFWVFDEQNAQLKKMGDNGQAAMSTDDLRQVFGESLTPEEIVDAGGLVYLNDTARGIYLFDYYGGFKVKLSFRGVTAMSVFGKTIYGLVNGELFSYRPGTLQEEHLALPIPVGDADQVQIVFNGVYVLRKGVLYRYSITSAP